MWVLSQVIIFQYVAILKSQDGHIPGGEGGLEMGLFITLVMNLDSEGGAERVGIR